SDEDAIKLVFKDTMAGVELGPVDCSGAATTRSIGFPATAFEGAPVLVTAGETGSGVVDGSLVGNAPGAGKLRAATSTTAFGWTCSEELSRLANSHSRSKVSRATAASESGSRMPTPCLLGAGAGSTGRK